MAFASRAAIRAYRLKKTLVLLFFITYGLVQCAGQLTSPRREYFPIFGWSLFSTATNPDNSLEVEILRIGDTKFAEPVNFFELDAYFEAASSRSTNVLKSAGRVLNLHRGDPAAAEAARRVFEITYFGAQVTVDYQFVAVTYDPIERWRTGKVLERQLVGRFSTEEAP